MVFSVKMGLFIAPVVAQTEYVVFFKDKAQNTFSLDSPSAFLSERALLRREKQKIALDSTDLPVPEIYLEEIKQIGATVVYTSRWFNAALLQSSDAVKEQILNLTFLDTSNMQLGTLAPENVEEIVWDDANGHEKLDYGNSFTQIGMLGIDQMHQKGFHGEGIQIALLDAGYARVDEIIGFDSLFANGQLLGTYDFVDQEENVFDDHRHGMQVLATLGAYEPGKLMGSAYKASYYLFRTENVHVEERKEEFLWAVAAEYADSAGVDIITASLGYNLFDNLADDYSPNQLDGQQAMVTKAAGFATQKGMLVVTSAGNEGNQVWKTLTAPADHAEVLAVGAVDVNQEKVGFSSIGPTADGRVKPDVMAMGRGVVVYAESGNLTTISGTSFAAPMVAGLAAGVWQALPTLSNHEVMQEIIASGSIAQAPNNEMGHGIPNFPAIMAKYESVIKLDENVDEIQVWPNPSSGLFSYELPEELVGQQIEINIWDMMGKALFQQVTVPDAQVCSMTLPNYYKGHFLMRVQSSTHVYYVRFSRY